MKWVFLILFIVVIIFNIKDEIDRDKIEKTR